MDSGHVENLWEMFKTVDDTHVVTDDQLANVAADGVNISKDDAQNALRLYAKAAKACSSVEEFRAVLEEDEYPPIQLTESEMELAKGGARKKMKPKEGARATSGVSDGSCHGETKTSSRSNGSCHGEA
ncbi:MAG: hypothetical protein CMH56_10055 [Myxococcales bacterium]|nr:hypothetical protein [Myxococcales bacterium]